ncbi:MAG: hypothetical protein LBK60_09090 [Verrucomicrobiales bacterium]|jgi:hypothetical protein|nr:hypothetical protein [Verrucomicrobiales bacterium]
MNTKKFPQPQLEHVERPRLWYEVDFVTAGGHKLTLHFGAAGNIDAVERTSGYLLTHHPGAEVTALRGAPIGLPLKAMNKVRRGRDA